MSYAPIALFTYSRADHTKAAVDSLLQNSEAKDSDLYIFSDGPKTEDNKIAVDENRKYIHTIKGFKSINIIEHERNCGLANSLITGITDVVNKHGKVIVVEDDLVLSPYFLKFMNDGLDKYEDEENVGAISGFVYPVGDNLPNTFFLRYFNCWGWATWKRSWDLFNPDTKCLLRKMRFKVNDFDNLGVGAYGNLYCQKVGLVDSWWVRFYASLFLAGKLTLYPCRPLSGNEGMDGTGTHCKSSDAYRVVLSTSAIELDDITIEESEEAFDKHRDYLHPKTSSITYGCIKSFIRRLFYIDCL